MDEPIEDLYFKWLCSKVLPRNSRDYYSLMEILYKTEFVWVVSADKHRAEDGIELRQDFLRETKADVVFDDDPCSIFEMLIAFSARASFQTDNPVRDWFWQFLSNLQLDQFRNLYDSDIPVIEDILYTFVWRIYKPNGHGGICPLNKTTKDQRDIELWYQLCEYFDDQGLF